MGQTLGLSELQKKMESQQATLAELLKMLKPGQAPMPLPLNGTSAFHVQQPSLSIVKSWDAVKVRPGRFGKPASLIKHSPA